MKRIIICAILLALPLFVNPAVAKTYPRVNPSPFSTVTVDNDTTNPVPLIDVAGATQPFQGTLYIEIFYPSDRGYAEASNRSGRQAPGH